MDTVHVLPILKAQHQALDMLMAMVINRDTALLRVGAIKHDKTFRPSESGSIWEACVAGNDAVKAIEAGAPVEA